MKFLPFMKMATQGEYEMKGSIHRDERYWNRAIETMSREELKRLQERRLRSQIKYVYKNSPFYRRKYKKAGIVPDDIRTIEDLSRLPVTTKDEMREAIKEYGNPFPHLCTPIERIVGFGPSRGTTGEPTFYAFTREDIQRRVEWMARAFYQMGLRQGMLFHAMMAIQRMTHFVMKAAVEMIGGVYVNDGVDNPPISIQMGKWLRPSILLTGTRNLLAMEKVLMEEEGRLPRDAFDYRSVILYGDVLGKGIVDHVREFWGAKDVFNLAGSAADLLWLNFDCPEHLGNHCINEDMFVIEVIDQQTGRGVEEGKWGELVVTDLCTKGTPHVRWNLEDAVIPHYDPCPCGRTHVRLTYLGRSIYRLTVKGRTIFPVEVEDILWGIPEIRGAEFRMVKFADDMDRLKVEIESFPGRSYEDLKAIVRREIKKELAVDSEIDFIPPDRMKIMDAKAMRILDLRGKN